MKLNRRETEVFSLFVHGLHLLWLSARSSCCWCSPDVDQPVVIERARIR
jgi:hypothetical protein